MPKTITAIAAVLVALLIGGCASLRPAPAATDELPPLMIPYERHVLPNGLTLILHEDHKAPVVAVNVWYHVGSKDERPGRTGFAHLFEHLMFEGSENHNRDFFEPLERIGATDANGTTNTDRTNYFENVPTPALDLALWLESDRMGHLLGAIDQAKLDAQRGVVKNERRQRYDNAPYGRVWEVLQAASYPNGHPYSWSTIGSLEDLDRASLDEVKDWFREYYGAANAVVVVAGDINPADTLAKVKQYFGDIPPGPTLRRMREWIAPIDAPRRVSLEDRVPQPRLIRAWNTPPIRSPVNTLLNLAAATLGSGKNSRLYKRLVYEEQLATSAYAAVWERELGSQFIVDVMAKPDVDLRRIEAIIDEELRRFLAEGPTAEELARIKTAMFAGWLRGAERIGGSGGKSDILAYGEVLAGSADYYRQYQDSLRSATPDAVRGAAQDWLRAGHVTLEVLPRAELQASAAHADRSRLPEVGVAPDLKLPELQHGRLSNGLPFAVAERRSAPLVAMRLLVDAGFAADDPQRPGLARMTFEMLEEGTRGRGALEIDAELDRLGARLGTGSDLDFSWVTMSALRSRLGASLDLFADVVRRPTFPAHELARLKPMRLAEIQQIKARPFGLALRALPPLLYGPTHPYGKPWDGAGTATAVRSFTVADLQEFYTRWVRPDKAQLLVVGDIGFAEARALLEARFGDWSVPTTPPPDKPLDVPPAPSAPRVVLINRSDAPQTLVLAANLAPPRRDPAHIAMVTVNNVLGGMFTSRLNLNLREDKHWSYGAGSGLRNARGPRTFYAYASVEAARSADAMRELLGELRGITGARPLRADEVEAAKNNLVLSLPGDNETIDEVASSFLNLLAYELPDDYYNQFVSRVRALPPAALLEAARRMIRPQDLTWIVVGDLNRIGPAVRRLGLGAVQVFDPEAAESAP